MLNLFFHKNQPASNTICNFEIEDMTNARILGNLGSSGQWLEKREISIMS